MHLGFLVFGVCWGFRPSSCVRFWLGIGLCLLGFLGRMSMPMKTEPAVHLVVLNPPFRTLQSCSFLSFVAQVLKEVEVLFGGIPYTKGDIGAALNNATRCLHLRLKLLNRTFHISSRI